MCIRDSSKKAGGQAQLERQAARAAGGRGQPEQSNGRLRQTIAAKTRRVRRTQLCPLLRDGWNATLHLARTREYSEAVADPRRRIQPQFGTAEYVGSGHAPRAEKPGCEACFAPS